MGFDMYFIQQLVVGENLRDVNILYRDLAYHNRQECILLSVVFLSLLDWPA